MTEELPILEYDGHKRCTAVLICNLDDRLQPFAEVLPVGTEETDPMSDKADG